MREPLTVAVAQPACVPYDVAANAATHAAVVRDAGARVVLFPELSLTGYELAADVVPADHPALAPLVAACRETGTLALAGAPVDGPHIGMFAIDGRVEVAYRKLYLGGPEPARFRPARTGPVVMTVDGWRLGLAICKDTGVAQHQADTVALGIDAYVGGVAMGDDEVGDLQDRGARIAREHGVWVALASFAGRADGYERTAGHSAIWSPDGAVVAQAGLAPGTFVTASMSMPALRP